MSKSHNVIAVTFDEDSKEHEALSMLRQADREGRVVVRCAAIVERRLGENVRIRDGEDNSISDLYRRSREVRLRGVAFRPLRRDRIPSPRAAWVSMSLPPRSRASWHSSMG